MSMTITILALTVASQLLIINSAQAESTVSSNRVLDELKKEIAAKQKSAVNTEAQTLDKFELDFKAEKLNLNFTARKRASYVAAFKSDPQLADAKLVLKCKTTLCRLQIYPPAANSNHLNNPVMPWMISRPINAVEQILKNTENCAFSVQPPSENEGIFGPMQAQIDCRKQPEI